MVNSILIALYGALVTFHTCTSQLSCVQKSSNGLKEWLDSRPFETVTWEPSEVCHTHETCYGMPSSESMDFRPQITPLLTQPNALILFKSSSQSLKIFRTNLEGFLQCKFEEANVLLDASNVPVISGSNYFIANDTKLPWNKCSSGQRVNITTLSFNCSSTPTRLSPSSSSTFCTGRGKCLASPYETSYQCVCCEAFIGTYCEQLDGCSSNTPVCLNGGYCTDGPDLSLTLSSFTCRCAEGFTGKNCEQEDKGACQRNQCMNGGACIENNSTTNGFVCQCVAGFEGQVCETDVDDCVPNPCQNSGKCVDLVNGFKCECPKWFSGMVCQVDGRPCKAGVCRNGGTCVLQENGTVVCYCPIGFSGKDCSDEGISCFPNPCKHSTECVAYPNNSHSCICKPGYHGVNCDLKVNTSNPSCASSPCRGGGGLCEELAVGYQCRCDDAAARLDCGANVSRVGSVSLDTKPTSPDASQPYWTFIIIGIVVIIVILVFIIFLVLFLNRRKPQPPYQPYSVSEELRMRELQGQKSSLSAPRDDAYPDETISYSTTTLSSSISADRPREDTSPVVKRSVNKNVVV